MAAKDTASWCDACAVVGNQLKLALETRQRQEVIETGKADNEIARFGTVGDIFDRLDCPSCQALQREMQRWTSEYDWLRSDDFVVCVVAMDSLYLDGDASQCWQPLYLQAHRQDVEVNGQDTYERIIMNLFFTEPAAKKDFIGRFFDANKIEMELVKGWIRRCEVIHGKNCRPDLVHRPKFMSTLKRILLVDVEQRCLAYGTLNDKYLALSYVWGQSPTVRTTVAALQLMMTPGIIDYDSSDPELLLPETIRDLMRLAQLIGVRYVWADALCIVQDAPDLNEHLNSMAAIYASAYLTIISEGTDADFGLPGIGNGARLRSRACRPLELPGLTVLLDDNMIPPKKPRTWEKRGWTFQEALACGRAVIFEHGGTVSWKCGKEFWSETHIKPSELSDWRYEDVNGNDPDWRYFGLAGLNFDWPDMRRWCVIAEEYYVRELSYDYDALNALAGLMSVVNKTSPGGFVWGLPAYFFDIFILWDVTWRDAEKTPQRRDPAAGIPTWSFLGWKGGELDTLWWRFSMNHTFIENLVHGFGHDVIVTPTVKQWCLEDPDSKEMMPIENSFYTERSQPLTDLDSEWKMHMSDSGTSYTHFSLGGEMKFQYPVPLLKTISSDTPIILRYSKCLHFKTRMGIFSLGDLIIKPKKAGQLSEEKISNVALLDLDGTWAGAIRLLPSQVEVAKQTHPRQKIDLIEVAEGEVQEDAWPKTSKFHGYDYHIPEWHCEDRPRATTNYKFYFVLWVEWENGTAYRKALGRVEKEAWLRVAREYVEIRLG